jgi:hypothetical protein
LTGITNAMVTPQTRTRDASRFVGAAAGGAHAAFDRKFCRPNWPRPGWMHRNPLFAPCCCRAGLPQAPNHKLDRWSITTSLPRTGQACAPALLMPNGCRPVGPDPPSIASTACVTRQRLADGLAALRLKGSRYHG